MKKKQGTRRDRGVATATKKLHWLTAADQGDLAKQHYYKGDGVVRPKPKQKETGNKPSGQGQEIGQPKNKYN